MMLSGNQGCCTYVQSIRMPKIRYCATIIKTPARKIQGWQALLVKLNQAGFSFHHEGNLSRVTVHMARRELVCSVICDIGKGVRTWNHVVGTERSRNSEIFVRPSSALRAFWELSTLLIESWEWRTSCSSVNTRPEVTYWWSLDHVNTQSILELKGLIVCNHKLTVMSSAHDYYKRNAIHGRDFEVKSKHLQLRAQMWTHRHFRPGLKIRGGWGMRPTEEIRH